MTRSSDRRDFARIAAAWLMVLAIVFQNGLAVACAGHDLLHAGGDETRQVVHQHCPDHGESARTSLIDVTHDLFHACHASLHAPAVLLSFAVPPSTPGSAAPASTPSVEPPSQPLGLTFRPPIRG